MKSFITLIFLFSTIISYSQSIQRLFVHNNLNRIYRIHVPAVYDTTKAVPLVMAFHGLGDQASNFQGVGFSQLANQDTFIVIYPQATVDQFFGATAWNAGVGAFGFFLSSSVDDVGFVSSLIDSLSNEFLIDSNRIYATGFSLGGFMSERLACELNHRLAAIASVSGTIGNAITCTPGNPLPVLHMHGTADSTVTYMGEFAIPGFGYTKVGLSVDELVNNWTDIDNCTQPVVLDSLPNNVNDGLRIERYTYGQCEQESEFIFYKIYNGVHTWLRSPQNDIDATETIWEFFQTHSRKTTTVGINKISWSDNISIFPNPVQNQLHIKLQEPVDKVVISNLLGQEIKKMATLTDLNIEVSLKDMESGIYLVSILKGNNYQTYKVVKN